MKNKIGLMINVIVFVVLIVTMIINQDTFSNMKKNFNEVAELLETCNQRVDHYDDMLVECQDMATYAQDHWQYWMDSYELLIDQGCRLE